MNLMDYIVEQALILIPVLYILGMMLKNTQKIKDWSIPWILLVVGVIGAISLMGLNPNAIIQGILATGAAVYTNQLIKQSTEKKEQD
ncbi:phage holin family protein [Clostridium sporogenes]|uniref:phage holin family protein n=1 Tax=Clostridium sporogenes TaxID=1509 RepID=UPI0022379E50|nr:phage holin family protein [Clostridium sporogenes]MCW6075454.1 phage holin family protein [Clostridium sporogenes]